MRVPPQQNICSCPEGDKNLPTESLDLLLDVLKIPKGHKIQQEYYLATFLLLLDFYINLSFFFLATIITASGTEKANLRKVKVSTVATH